MNNRPTIVLVLKNGKGFAFRDVQLIAKHINGKWKAVTRPRIICLWDQITEPCDLGSIELLPLTNTWPGTWARMILYSPQMEQYKPFLYVDLDTAVIQSLENIFGLVTDPSRFITLEDFWNKRKLATPLVWFPADCEKTKNVWKAWKGEPVGFRMDYFLRKHVAPDLYWQQLTTTIYDFKPRNNVLLDELPADASLVCFHGKPRIFDIVDSSMSLSWVQDYVNTEYEEVLKKKVTVIIPYKKDRGWLQDAIDSIPADVQLIVSQGEGNWPANFNKVLGQAEGDYIKFLHEDDMLLPNCIEDSVKAIEEQGVDFIHGNAVELFQGTEKLRHYKPRVTHPTVKDLLAKNVIHCPTLMYRKEVFDKIGTFDESLNNQEEYEFNLRCLKAGLKIGYCDSFLAVYRRHSTQKVRTLTQTEIKKEKELVNKKYIV